MNISDFKNKMKEKFGCEDSVIETFIEFADDTVKDHLYVSLIPEPDKQAVMTFLLYTYSALCYADKKVGKDIVEEVFKLSSRHCLYPSEIIGLVECIENGEDVSDIFMLSLDGKIDSSILFPLYEPQTMHYTVENTLDLYKQGKRLDFLLFFNEKSNCEITDKYCLNPWDNEQFVSLERYTSILEYLIAKKAMLSCYTNSLDKIFEASDERIRRIWDCNKYEIAKKGYYSKFEQHEDLKEYLLSTGDKILVFASPYDSVWGVKISADNKDIYNPEKWQGKNLLGFVLMEVRDALRNAQEKNI